MITRFAVYILLTFFFGAPTIITGLLVYWYNEGVPINYAGRTMMTPIVAPGDELRIRIEAEVAKPACRAIVDRVIIDAAGTLHDVVSETRPERSSYIVVVNVPLGASPGKAYYRAKVSWICNPVQEYFPLVILQPDLPFEIIPAEGQLQIPRQQGVYQVPMNKSELMIGELK